MGNYISSTCSCACINTSSDGGVGASTRSESKRKLLRTIIVVHSVEGQVMEVGTGASMTVAELMLEYPGHFVSAYCKTDHVNSATDDDHVQGHAAGICKMKRASPLPADHEATPGSIYILFPMHRLHTRVPPQESTLLNTCISSHLSAASCAASSKKKKKPHNHHYPLHGLQASSKVTPLNTHSDPLLQQQEENLHPHGAEDDQIGLSDEEIDDFLQQFCSTQQQKGSGIAFNHSSSLVRSKSWIPKLETISESSILSA